MAEKIIIDCDPGIHDAIALLMAQASPQCEVIGITTVSGNQTIEKVTGNALQLAELLGMSGIPVAQGAAEPLVRNAVQADPHGETGLGGFVLPETERRPIECGAVEFIVSSVQEHPAQSVTLVAIGPLTNVALALRADPSLAHRLKRIVIMGGGHHAGNITPSAEFNFYADAEAAAEVLESGAAIVMLGLDLTWQSAVSDRVRAEIAALTSPVARAVDGWLSFYAQGEVTPGEEGPSIHDACAIAYVINASIVQTRPAAVLVETQGQWTYGESVVDEHGRFDREPNAELGTRLDRDAFWRLVTESLMAYER